MLNAALTEKGVGDEYDTHFDRKNLLAEHSHMHLHDNYVIFHEYPKKLYLLLVLIGE